MGQVNSNCKNDDSYDNEVIVIKNNLEEKLAQQEQKIPESTLPQKIAQPVFEHISCLPGRKLPDFGLPSTIVSENARPAKKIMNDIWFGNLRNFSLSLDAKRAYNRVKNIQDQAVIYDAYYLYLKDLDRCLEKGIIKIVDCRQPSAPPVDLTVSISKNSDQKCTNSECSICLEEIQEGGKNAILTCDHGFHKKCLGVWILESPTCPLCQKKIDL